MDDNRPESIDPVVRSLRYLDELLKKEQNGKEWINIADESLKAIIICGVSMREVLPPDGELGPELMPDAVDDSVWSAEP